MDIVMKTYVLCELVDGGASIGVSSMGLEAQTHQDGAGPGLEGGGVQLVLLVVQVHQQRGLGALLHQQVLDHRIQASDLLLGRVDHIFQGRDILRRSLMAQKIHLEVLGDRNLSGSQTLEEGTLTAAVAAQKTITSTHIQLNNSVLHQISTVEGQRELSNLNIASSKLGH